MDGFVVIWDGDAVSKSKGGEGEEGEKNFGGEMHFDCKIKVFRRCLDCRYKRME